jgi:molybdopterin molybdotransferase
MTQSETDCCAAPGRALLSVEEGRKRILDAVPTLRGTQYLPLSIAFDRILAAPITAALNIPSFDNSAMDGYAVRSVDCDHTPCILQVIGTSYAGTPFPGGVAAGQCVRIMTGAAIPTDADAVIMQEYVNRSNEQIHVDAQTVLPGQNMRLVGEDIRRGDQLLEAGVRLGAAEIGMLASNGFNEVRVIRKLRVAHFSTGDELISAGSPLKQGQIYDSNRYTLSSMLSRPDIERYDLGLIPDRREAIKDAFRSATEMADVVVTTGGVSVGQADHVKDAASEMGEIKLWRMAMKPGKPLAFGLLNSCVFFGLPGNPVSVMATFYQFVLPAMRKMTAQKYCEPLVMLARCTESLNKSPGRMEFQRGILSSDGQGRWQVSTTGRQGSHVLSSMSKANCFILLPAESSGLAQGETALVQPFVDFSY